jgi:hypothetical protein
MNGRTAVRLCNYLTDCSVHGSTGSPRTDFEKLPATGSGQTGKKIAGKVFAFGALICYKYKQKI